MTHPDSPAATTPAATTPTATTPTQAEPIRVEPLSAADSAAVLALDQWAFGSAEEDVDPQPLLRTFRWDRSGGVWADDRSRLAGFHFAHEFDLPVPGGRVPCSGLTWVGVHPQFRRRGVLRAMMRYHLDLARAAGEPISLLFAAEPAIYGRFGYGMASRRLDLTLRRRAGLRDVPGWREVRLQVEAASVERHAELVGDCYEAARAARPGMVSRGHLGLRDYALIDQPHLRRGGESLRIVVARDATGAAVRGCALFRRRPSWKDGVPDGTVAVREVIAADPAAARALWGFLTDLDLTARVETPPLALDDPLVSLLVDVRDTAARHSDGLWARLVDVPAALAARRYAAPVDLVVQVRDALYPDNAGRWHLGGSTGSALCEPTDQAPDLDLDVRELASAYLGGESLAALAAAGLVTELRAGAVTEAAAAFGWPVAPHCSWEF